MSVFDKVSSFDQLLKNAVATFVRFPFTLLSAILGTAISIFMVEMSSSDSGLPQRLLMAAALGLPLFTALVLWGEKQLLNRQQLLFLQLGGVALLTIYFFTLPEEASKVMYHSIRFSLFSIGLHFLVAFLPYLKKGSASGFWQYNKTLFLQFLVAALYTSVMFIGLTIALASADHLFGIEIKWERYLELWIVLTGVFHTWVFLSGLPTDFSALEKTDDYPKGLKVFTQYILLPLVTLYIVILFAYEAKIVFTWNWPIGWVSNLVLWYSVVGIFSLLLLHPLRERAENRWIVVYSRWFFRALIPLVAMLFLAILRRISDYGVTENRYFVMGMAIGLTIVVLYFVFSKLKDIRIIPITLCSIAFLSSFGPWGAISVSLNSQQSRLDGYLIKNRISAPDSIATISEQVSLEDRKEMSSIVEYLTKVHGKTAFSEWIDDSTLNSLDTVASYLLDNRIAELIGFEFAGQWQKSISEETKTNSFNFQTLDNKPLTVSGYDYLVKFNMSSSSDYFYSTSNRGIIWRIPIEGDTALVRLYNDRSTISIQYGDSSKAGNLMEFAVAKQFLLLRDSSMTGEISADNLTFSASATDFDAQIVISYVRGSETTDGIELTSLGVKLLLRIH